MKFILRIKHTRMLYCNANTSAKLTNVHTNTYSVIRQVPKIWMCWFQGEDALMKHGPKINKCAFRAWKSMYPHLTLITNSNVHEFLPNFATNDHARASHSADLLRLMLLYHYGGLWIDMSVIPTMKLEKWLPDEDFFTFRFLPRSENKTLGNRETVSWFLYVKEPKNYLIEKWLNVFEQSYNHGISKYFQMHEHLCDLVDTDEKIKHTIENMSQISEKHPHKKLINGKFDVNDPNVGVLKRPNLDVEWYESIFLSDGSPQKFSATM